MRNYTMLLPFEAQVPMLEVATINIFLSTVKITSPPGTTTITIALEPSHTMYPSSSTIAARSSATRPRAMAILILFLFFVQSAFAFCECGYTISSTAAGSSFAFTDIIESDFLHIKDISKDTDWSVQGYAVTAQDSRGPYGTNFTTINVISNPIADATNWTAPGVLGGTPGMQLIVSGGTPSGGYINTAQINSVRTDLMYGSYRLLAELPSVNGTCSAFFDYYNNSQEVDMEALSSQFYHNGTNMINLVQQTPASAARGYSILGTDYDVEDLPFDPTSGYHEYRFDVLPGQIYFYGDGILIGKMNASAPAHSRHIILSHWSNGNPLWSGGPPISNAVMNIGYFKAYFNSSDPDRQSSAIARCPDPTAAGVYCPVSDASIVNGTLFSEFFSQQPNMTNNQTIYDKKSGTAGQDTIYTSSMALFGLTVAIMLFL